MCALQASPFTTKACDTEKYKRGYLIYMYVWIHVYVNYKAHLYISTYINFEYFYQYTHRCVNLTKTIFHEKFRKKRF